MLNTQAVLDYEGQNGLATRIRALSSREREEYRQRERKRCQKSLFYLARTALNFTKLTTSLHLPVCEFVQRPTAPLPDGTRTRRKGVLLPRGHYKSSCVTLSYPVWTIIQPDLSKIPICSDWENDEVEPLIDDTFFDEMPGSNITILLANETATGAEHFLSWIEAIFESDSYFRFLFWDICSEIGKAKRWNAREMLIPARTISRPEATVETIGVGGAVQGRHYRMQIKDDLIGKNAMESVDIMSKTKEWVEYADSIFVAPEKDVDLFVGTRWARGDIYESFKKDGRYAIFHRKAVEEGSPIFPDEFSMSFFNHLASKSPFYYRSQYQNDPRGEGSIDLDSVKLQPYRQEWQKDGSLTLVVESENPSNPDVPLIERIRADACFGASALDPSREENFRHGSRKAWMTCCRDHKGRTYVLDAWASRGSHDEMFDQCFRGYEKWEYPLGVETVVFQKILLWVFEKEQRRRRRWMPVIELRTSTKKTKVERIRSLVQNELNLLLIYIPVSGISEDFAAALNLLRQSMDDFPESKELDLLDVLAYCLQMLSGGEPFSEEDQAQIIKDEEFLLHEVSDVTGY